MLEDTPWSRYVIVGLAVFLLVLAFQTITRGELTISIAILVAVGYLAMSELVRRYR